MASKLEVEKSPRMKAATLKELMAALRSRDAYRIAPARTAAAMVRC
jgi:hypothetical protein